MTYESKEKGNQNELLARESQRRKQVFLEELSKKD